MRLLKREHDGRLSLTRFLGKDTPIPPYAILSHTWDTDYKKEVSFKDIKTGLARNRANYVKIEFCLNQAHKDGLEFVWIDTCCIKKESEPELTAAINSMYRWYRDAAKCYVYMSDISSVGFVAEDWELAFRKSRWFTRGWTLQELLAPASVEFFDRSGNMLGDKRSLERMIHETTGIAIIALRGSLFSFSVEERLSWARGRDTKRDEDAVYSLLGIFNAYMPLIYGEGRRNAQKRLMKIINEDQLETLMRSVDFLDSMEDDLDKSTHLPASLTQGMGRSNQSLESVPVTEPENRRDVTTSGSDMSLHEMVTMNLNPSLDTRPSLIMNLWKPPKVLMNTSVLEAVARDNSSYPTLRNILYTHRITSNTYLRKRVTGRIYQWKWLAQYLGIIVHMVSSKRSHGDTLLFYLRWQVKLPLRFGRSFTAWLTVRDAWPSLPKLALSPQNVILSNSRIVQACEGGDLLEVRMLLQSKQAHPNDRTVDDLTVFRYAIRSNNSEVVRLLLDHGADSNLQFGTYETSPLNNAFFVGNVAIIRMLLEAGADLDYRNLRSWSSVSYLWDPHRSSHRHTREILDICVEQGFSDWNEPDRGGWSAVHRAAAYGVDDDIRVLSLQGANMHAYSTNHLWGPVTCAVWNKNESTFDALADMIAKEEFVAAVDDRGWTLMHLAAQTGSKRIMRRLRDMGVSVDALTMPTTRWVNKELEGKKLTAEEIAREYGYGEAWNDAVTMDIHL